MYYKKIEIHSEKDLPKEQGRYFYHHKKANRIECSEYYADYDDEFWMSHIDWYLLPVELPTDEEINKWIDKMKFNHRDWFDEDSARETIEWMRSANSRGK